MRTAQAARLHTMPTTNPLIALAKPIVSRFPRVASLYRSVRDELDFRDEPRPTPWGFRLAGNAAMAAGTFEPEETALVRSLLADADVLVNVGANVGYYCCHALAMGKEVIAFEPVPRNLRYLCRNVQVNGWSCEIYALALSNAVGVLEIYGGDTGASLVKGWAGIPASYSTLVPCSTMDRVLGERLAGRKAVVLIDVEGAEQWVLEGAAAMLANSPKPAWVIEIAVAEHQPAGTAVNPRLAATFAHMAQAGYEPHTANAARRTVTAREIEAAQRGDASALETHNFLFL